MKPTPQTDATNSQGGGLFLTADGKNLFIVFALVTSLFLLWGFCNGMIDILNKHFQDSLHINKEQSGLVQFANYLAYFLMAIPAGLIARRFGYKGGIIVGLLLIASGAFWFIPATNIGEYWAFLLGLFIIAAGMTCLETIANPYTTLLGQTESGATRINIAQTFNGVGWILGPVVGAQFVFSGGEGTNTNAGLHIPYLGIAIFVSILLVVFIFSNVPDLRAEDENQKSAERRTVIKPSSGQLAVIGIILAIICGLLYFFIAPILGLIWAMLSIPEASLQPTKYGLLVVGYVISFMLVSKNWDMFRRKHYTLGIGTQFLYVAAQTGIFSFFVNYVLENDPGVTKLQASHRLGLFGFGLFMFGRLCGSGVISQFKPHLVLATYSAINVVLCAVMTGGGTLGLFALFGTFFFMSVMFPTIFALGIRGLGDYTKLGSSLIVMSIVGGAIAPPFMGHIADAHSMRIGMVVPLVCFVFIAIYGATWQRLEAKGVTNGIASPSKGKRCAAAAVIAVCLAALPASAAAVPVQSVQSNADGTTLTMSPGKMKLTVFSDSIVRVMYSPNRSKNKRIAVIGPNGKSTSMLYGNYHGSASHPISILNGIKQLAGTNIEVTFAQGCPITTKTDRGIAAWSRQDNDTARPLSELNAEALSNAANADLIIFVGGITPAQEGEGFDRDSIELPEVQEKLLQALHATGKPVVMVNCSGSAIALPWEAEHLPAILQAWYPGEEGGRAVGEILFGDVNPSGHLPLTFYRATADLPSFTDYSMSNRTYRYFNGTPLYAFGHGLSYTTFDFKSGKLGSKEIPADGTAKVIFTVKNSGSRDGDEVAQVYYRHVNSAVPQPKLALCGFTRVQLKHGESTQITVEIPAQRLRYWDTQKKQYVVEPGDYEILIGAASDDIRLKLPVTITAQ